jgi:alpha-aminoadipic semialdehyde synthase
MIPDKTFIYFSHTIKAQLHNMPALDALLNKNIRLIDYERITDDKNNRLIAFGKYAGMAGAIDFLKGFG